MRRAPAGWHPRGVGVRCRSGPGRAGFGRGPGIRWRAGTERPAGALAGMPDGAAAGIAKRESARGTSMARVDCEVQNSISRGRTIMQMLGESTKKRVLTR